MSASAIYKLFVAIFFSVMASYSIGKDCSRSVNAAKLPPMATNQSSPVFLSTTSEPFPSKVFSVIALNDESYAFASLSDAVIEGVSSKPSAVIALLKKEEGEWKVSHYFSVIPDDPSITKAFGLALSRDESVLAVAVRDGIALFDVASIIQKQPIPTYVDLHTGYYDKRIGPGSIAIVAAKNNKHFFVADEYGESQGYQGVGDVAVVSYERDITGAIFAQRQGYVKPEQNAIAGINISPDGKTLYIPSQTSSEDQYLNFSGLDHPEIAKPCGNSFSGSISIVDVDTLLQKAELNPGDGNRVIDKAIQAKIAAGCGVVRVAVSSDGKTIWSTARTDNTIHAFDAALLRSNPNYAYLYSFSSAGFTPVGISSFSQDRYLAVSNSNRFGAVDENGQLIPPNISIFDVSRRGDPELLQTIASGNFPRDIYRTPDNSSVVVANWLSFTLQKISVAPTHE
ncbi:hypothetical protein FA101_32410 [Pseudomonas aeruginosa]|uniref:hypothetical protein n=1 Tax=Pseudomonas aeruginosa TaxID=287 RepID=UPI00345AEED3|nr:hypothetical protein [Pseudomonas aeruginosa]